MTTYPKSDLACLREGTRFLASRPLAVLGIAALGTLLFALAAWIQLRAGLPDDQTVEQLVTFAGLVPLELYFIPRLMIALDAQSAQHPLNLPDAWKHHFEERWLRAFGAKVLLSLAAGLGLVLLVLPGLMVLMMFGWVPLRVLLRGESLLQAARNSLQMMIHAWPRVLLVGSAIAMVYLASTYGMDLLLDHFVPDAGPWARLTHPLVWVVDFAASLVSIWVSASFLALYHKVEQLPAAADPAGL